MDGSPGPHENDHALSLHHLPTRPFHLEDPPVAASLDSRRSQLHDRDVYSETVLSEQRTLWRSVGGSAAIIPADGCVDLIVRSGQVLLCGPQTRVIRAPADVVHPTVGLRLEAGTARGLLPVALSELRNRVVELRTALGSEAAALYDLMMRASSASRPDLVLSALLVDQAEPWVTTTRRLARSGASAREAARALDWSERTFRRRMLKNFGYGYATLVRVERAHRARSLLQRGLSPADVSAMTGYADQSHLTREFARMVGVTPAQFSKAAKRSTLLPSGSSTVA